MGVASLFKTGLIVRDLPTAIDDLGRWLALDFTPIQESPLELETAKGRETIELRYVYSTSGPVYLELIEAQPSGYYRLDAVGPHLHHVGRWVDDLASASAELAAAGLPLEAAGVGEDGTTPSTFAFHRAIDPSTGHGLRVELVPAANKPIFEAWLAGGSLEL